MVKCLNRVMVIGYVGRDPEMRYTPGGQAVTSFSVGAVREWTNSEGEHREEAEWFNVMAWSSLAEACKQQLGKGQLVYVEGRLHTRSWRDQEGEKCFRTELVAEGMIVLDGRRDVPETVVAADEGGGQLPVQ
jgi:single-strand DNA-binding protein